MIHTETERFWSKVDRTADCWTWTGATSDTGYGLYQAATNRLVRAHRYSYELTVGPIAEGLVIDHLCRNTSCVNPEHLEAVTQTENVRRGLRGELHETCPYGHPFKESAHTGGHVRTRRRCGPCMTARSALRYRMTPEEVAERKAGGLPVVDLAAHFARVAA